MIGNIYQHKNGTKYKVLALSNQESKNEKYPITVIYETLDSGKLWSRKLNDWDRSFRLIEFDSSSDSSSKFQVPPVDRS